MNGKYIGIVVAASALVLVGCSSSDDSPSGFVPSDLIIGESDTANAADDIDTLHLRRNAATLSSSSLGLNIIDQGLTLGTSLTGVVGQFADGFNSAQFDVSLSTGTVLEEDSSGAAKLSAGAFSYNLDASTSDGPITSSFAASAGQCFESPGSSGSSDVFIDPVADQEDSDELLVIVDCGAP